MEDAEREDSLSTVDQFRFAETAATLFPAHTMALRRNRDGLTWAVLTPRDVTRALLHFTFCRVQPSIVVEILDREGRRQFCSMPTMERALDLARHVSEQAILADTMDPRIEAMMQ